MKFYTTVGYVIKCLMYNKVLKRCDEAWVIMFLRDQETTLMAIINANCEWHSMRQDAYCNKFWCNKHMLHLTTNQALPVESRLSATASVAPRLGATMPVTQGLVRQSAVAPSLGWQHPVAPKLGTHSCHALPTIPPHQIRSFKHNNQHYYRLSQHQQPHPIPTTQQ